jgi:acetyl-CoA acetyltransferase
MAEVPILVGVGDIINRNLGVHHAAEPAELMLDAISIAFQDTGLSSRLIADLRTNIDSIDVVRTWTWPYPDLPGLLAERLGVRPIHTYCSPHAGNQPAKLVDEAARRIAKGETKLAIVTGGEALASLAACAKAGLMPPPNWTPVEKPVTQVFAPSTSEMAKGIGAKHTIGAPIQVYPLFENGLRAQSGQSLEDNNTESAKLYAEFAQVANKNPLAWSFPRTAETEDTIGRISNRNRMICSPCTAKQNFHPAELTSSRSSIDECLQHSKPRWSSHTDIRFIRPRARYRRK